MIGLMTSDAAAPIEQVGMVRMISHKLFGKSWLPLDDREYDPAIYPKLFAKIGYFYGHGTTNTTFFKLPMVNAREVGPGTVRQSYFLMPLNRGDRRDRNKGRVLGSIKAGSWKSHTHSGYTSTNGQHSHTLSGQWFDSAPRVSSPNADGSIPRSGSMTSMSASHGGHNHGYNPTSGPVSSSSRKTNAPEPVAMTAVACIYTGEVD